MLVRAIAATVCLGATAIPASAADWDSAGTPIARRHLEVGESKLHTGRLSDAIGQATKAIGIASDYGFAYFLRAEWLIEAGRYADAEGDIARFAAMHPDARGAYFLHATIALRRGDGKAAMEYLNRAALLPYRIVERGFDSVYANGSNAIFLADRSIAEALMGQADPSVADLQGAIGAQYERPWYVLNFYCYTAGIAGQLELAELACDEGIKRASRDDPHIYDSMGFVHLKMRKWTNAIADYNRALAETPDLTTSLYGRGIAKIATGDRAGSMADIEKARQGEPDIENIMSRLGAPTTRTVVAGK